MYHREKIIYLKLIDAQMISNLVYILFFTDN